MISTKDIIETISQQSMISPELINQEDSLLSIGIDSLSMVELIVALEDGFSVTFEDSDLEPSKLTTVRAVIELVKKHIKE